MVVISHLFSYAVLMKQSVVPVELSAVVPTKAGAAVFLTHASKSIVIYLDPSIGMAIHMFMQDVPKQRPLTHDLIASILLAFGAKVERVIINHFDKDVFYARLIISAENEITQKKIIELDARPSDCLAIATQQNAPVFVAKEVWDKTEDVSDTLEALLEEQATGFSSPLSSTSPDAPPSDEEDFFPFNEDEEEDEE